jgi:hypothetical protein
VSESIVGYRNYDAGFSHASMSKLLPVTVTTGQSPRGRGQTSCARLLYPYAARSLTSADVADLAQWAQQKKRPPTSTPCPITLHLQCSHIGAIAWIAHSKLSKVCRVPAAISSKLLSYSLPQTSHVAIPNLPHTALTDELRSWSTRCWLVTCRCLDPIQGNTNASSTQSRSAQLSCHSASE